MAATCDYQYAGLPPQHIRVLELQPAASPDESLSCKLITQMIHDEQYEALSYVWGNPTVYRSAIRCQNADDESSQGVLAIGLNLSKALIAYRLPEKPRRLWVDAISIKQEDLAERQAQVRMMGDIFRHASQVLCWLGPFTNPDKDRQTALLAIQFVKEFNEDQQGHLRRIQTHLHSSSNATDNTVDDDEALSTTWSAIKKFFDCEYFHRAWIIQEIGLARRALISWGCSRISIDWKDVAHFVLFLDDHGASVINQLELKSWVCNHINLVWSNDEHGKPLYDFSEVLHWARIHLSTDPRDFIYSLLGHPSAVIQNVPLIEPKYTISTEEVYTNLAINIIERTQSLHILAFVDHSEEPALLQLPSWVPDWHGLNLVAPLRYPTSAITREYKGINVEKSPNGLRVCSRGVIIDDISVYSDIISPKELAVTDHAAEIKKSIPFLIDHLHSKLLLAQSNPPISAEHFLDAISCILTGAFRANLPAVNGDARDQQRRDCAAYMLEFEKISRSPSKSLGLVHSLPQEEKAAIQNLASTGSAVQFVQDMTWTSMCRRVFRTANGFIGLGPRVLATGDVCVVVKGSMYPLVLRRQVDGFQLIGPALIYGLMDHETEAGGLGLEQDICIC